MSTIHAREVQHFRQTWLWALLLIGAIPALLVAVAAVVADSPGPWTDQLPLLAGLALLILGPLPLVYRARLVIEVRDDGLYLKLWPLHLSYRRIGCADIESVERVEVSPFGEFGGVGIRLNVRPTWDGLRATGPLGYVVQRGSGIRIRRADNRDVVVTTGDRAAIPDSLERVCV